MIDDEEFFAWLDGELKGDAADRVAAAVAASPELAARAERHRQLTTRMRGAFEPVIQSTTLPPRFQRAEIIDFGARATARERRRGWFSAPQWAAMAATLALGLVVGQFVGERSQSPVQIRDNQLVAAAALDGALDRQLASAGAAEQVHVGLTFRDGSGRICRSFRDAAASGLACRDGEQWQIRGLFPPSEGQGGDYRMAAGEDPRLAALIDEVIAGEPFDAGQEKAARDRGWR
jgi:anti-sigma factor RsiW